MMTLLTLLTLLFHALRRGQIVRARPTLPGATLARRGARPGRTLLSALWTGATPIRLLVGAWAWVVVQGLSVAPVPCGAPLARAEEVAAATTAPAGAPTPAAVIQGDVSLEVAVDRESVTAGDLLTYSVTCRFPAGEDVRLSPMGANLGEFVIRDFNTHEQALPDGRTEVVRSYVLAAYFTGERTIHEVTATRTAADGTTTTVTSAPITIQVASLVDADSQELRPPQVPRDIPPDYRPLYRNLAMTAGLLVTMGLVAFGLIRWLSRTRPVAPPPPRPAHELALEELARLRHADYSTEMDVKRFYFGLSDVLRQYVGALLGLSLMERTTEEIRIELRQAAQLSRDHFRMIMELLGAFDIVKFATHRPTEADRLAHLEAVEGYVRQTMPRSLDALGDSAPSTRAVHGAPQDSQVSDGTRSAEEER